MAKTGILMIDDEQGIIDLVSSYLKQENYQLFTANNGVDGLKSFRTNKPDLVVLDWMLPDMDGIEVLTQIRRESDVYVIMLTAKTEETDKIIGLSVGADDYVTKPFSPRELVARIKAAMRRFNTQPADATLARFNHLVLDVAGRRVTVDDQPVELTTTEFDLLKTLVEYRGMVLSREQLMDKVWGYEYYVDTRVVDVHIGHLRQKLGYDAMIATVRGVGYRFEQTEA